MKPASTFGQRSRKTFLAADKTSRAHPFWLAISSPRILYSLSWTRITSGSELGGSASRKWDSVSRNQSSRSSRSPITSIERSLLRCRRSALRCICSQTTLNRLLSRATSVSMNLASSVRRCCSCGPIWLTISRTERNSPNSFSSRSMVEPWKPKPLLTIAIDDSSAWTFISASNNQSERRPCDMWNCSTNGRVSWACFSRSSAFPAKSA